MQAMTLRSDRVCIRGCTEKGPTGHYADCEDFGKPVEEAECRGCAPRECRDGSLICDRCFGRMRGLLDEAPDLLGRLWSLADPMKAQVLNPVRVSSSSTEPPAPVGADLLDAITVVSEVVEAWMSWRQDLAGISNDLVAVEWFGPRVLDRHPEEDGIRAAWSVQDAKSKWGIERRDRDSFVYPTDEDEEEESAPVREWYDPLLTVAQAAERHKLTQRAVQKWVTKGLIEPVARSRGPRGSVLTYFYASAVDAAAKTAEANRKVKANA